MITMKIIISGWEVIGTEIETSEGGEIGDLESHQG